MERASQELQSHPSLPRQPAARQRRRRTAQSSRGDRSDGREGRLRAELDARWLTSLASQRSNGRARQTTACPNAECGEPGAVCRVLETHGLLPVVHMRLKAS